MPAQDGAGSDDEPHRGKTVDRQRPGQQRQPCPVWPRQPRMSPRPLAQGDRELMAQHEDLGVFPPRLPARQPEQGHRTGDDQEDQLQAHKPRIIAPRPGRHRPARHQMRRRTDGEVGCICPGGTDFRHAQSKGRLPSQFRRSRSLASGWTASPVADATHSAVSRARRIWLVYKARTPLDAQPPAGTRGVLPAHLREPGITREALFLAVLHQVGQCHADDLAWPTSLTASRPRTSRLHRARQGGAQPQTGLLAASALNYAAFLSGDGASSPP